MNALDHNDARAEATPDQRDGLLALLAALARYDYDFIAPTPATHARVVARPDRQVGAGVLDLLGWTLPTRPEAVPPDVLRAMAAADVLERRGDGLVTARVRASRVFGELFLHSAYPTDTHDAVFLGPDSHRFADFILRHADGLPDAPRILDYAAGAGIGGITAATQRSGARLTLADINPTALRLASVNARFAGVDHETTVASRPEDVDGSFDLIVTHPPFMMDADKRAYRDGGDLHGGQLSLDWTLSALAKLASGGRLVMHTGVSVVGGRDVLLPALREHMPSVGYAYDYRLLDPDIFGDELDQPPYAQVDRIAAIGLVVTRD